MRQVSHLIDRVGESFSVAPDILTNLRIALDEIVTNIVNYAYADDAPHQISIRCEIAEGCLRTTVEDDGVAFDPLDAPAPDVTSSLEDRPVGGLGVHFVKALMSAVRYERVNGRNRLSLTQALATIGSRT